MSPAEIDELVRRCRGGDQAAWKSLVDEYAGLVYSIPRRYKFGDADAADVFQTVFVSLLKNLDQIQDSQALTRWLMTTTQRACWKHAKKRRREQPVQTTPEASLSEHAPEGVLQTWERRHAVHRSLETLGGVCEKLLRALFQDRGKADYETVGTQLGIPPGSIGPTRRRCLAKLSEILIESGQFDRFGQDVW